MPGRVYKAVKDNRYSAILVCHYRFCHCHHTLRRYPAGVDQADQTLRLRKLSTIQWVPGEIKALLAEVPPEGSRRLFELWKQIPERHAAHVELRFALNQLGELMIRPSEYWFSYRVLDWQKDVPWTNNATG
jgi:hypothetical protein